MKQRKIPQRKCIVCGENKDKNDLIRIVKNKEEGIILDPTGKKMVGELIYAKKKNA